MNLSYVSCTLALTIGSFATEQVEAVWKEPLLKTAIVKKLLNNEYIDFDQHQFHKFFCEIANL
jgi:hypothetical protein